jgi:hypothetical protein
MKNIGICGLLGLAVSGLVVPAQAQPTLQVVWEAPATKPLCNSEGVALSAGLAEDGDGVLLQLGYFDAGTPASPFTGKFIALTGATIAVTSGTGAVTGGSGASTGGPGLLTGGTGTVTGGTGTVTGGTVTLVALQATSVGDSGGGAAGTFSINTSFKVGATVFQGAPPAVGTPLVIRFFDGKKVSTSTHYNVVSGGSNWQWKAPAEAPGAFVILSLADPGLVWQGGAASSFKTSIQGQPPEISTGGGGGGGGEEEVQAIIGAALALSVPEGSGTSFRTTYLPPGLRLNTATGGVSGVPTVAGSYRVLVTPSNSSGVEQAAVEFKINVAALSKGVVGKFSGLVERSQAMNSNLGASLQLTTTAAGLYSGRLLVGTRSYTLRGRLGLDPARPSEANLSVQLPQLGANVALALEFDGDAQTFTGTLTQNGTAAAVSGWQTPWTPAAPASSLQGAYTYRLSLPANAEATLPQGYGYGSLKVSASTGLVALISILADGTRVTGSAALGKAGEVAVYSSSVNASIAGQFALTAGTSALSLNALVGTLSWLKPAVAGTVYSAGFDPVNLEVAGGAPLAVPKGSLVLNLDPVSVAEPHNALLSFAEGGLDTPGAAFTRAVAVKPTTSVAKNTVTIPVGTPTTSMPTLNPSTGAFGGTFLIAGSSSATNRTVRFQGQVVTIDGETQGYGYFLMPTLPSGTLTLTTSPKLSGSVLFSKP